MVKPVRFTVVRSAFFTVIDCGALVVPTVTVPKFSEFGINSIDCPVPVRGTVCGLPGALSVKESVPLRAPLLVGVKVTLTTQLAPAATVAPQVLDEMW